MTDLSFEGKIALLPYVEQALQTGQKLDIEKLNADTAITDSDIIATIEQINDVMQHDASPVIGLNRRQLMELLANTLEMAYLPSALQMQGEVTVNPKQGWREQLDNSSVHATSEKEMNILAGPKAMSHRILRSFRHAAGWKAYTTLFPPNRLRQNYKQVVLELREQRISQLIEHGMSQKEAEKEVYRSYIAYDRIPYMSEHKRGQTMDEIDLSPNAIADLEQTLQPPKHEFPSYSVRQYCRRWAAAPCNTDSLAAMIVSFIHELREKKIDHRIAVEGAPCVDAAEFVESHYLGIEHRGPTQSYHIFLSAVPALDAKLQEKFPGVQPNDSVLPDQQRGYYLSDILGTWNVLSNLHGRKKIMGKLKELRDARIAMLIEQGASPEQAKAQTNASYIFFEHKGTDHYVVTYAAWPEVNAAMQLLFPDRKPRYNTEGRSITR